jgi:hypothetical protein
LTTSIPPPRLTGDTTKEQIMTDNLIQALLGHYPSGLRSDVSFAPPLTLRRIVGRTPVSEALAAYAQVLEAADADVVLKDDRLDGAIFTGDIDGRSAQVVALAERDDAGLIARIDMYGRPWPFMALVREHLRQGRPDLTDARLGDEPYVPEGPGNGWIDAPQIPPLADDVSFYSPILTAVATGRDINQRILAAASKVYGQQAFRAVLQVDGRAAVAGVFDGTVDGHTLQLVAMFTLNADSEIAEIRIFSRPWPVTAHFRAAMYELLKDALGPEFWQGPDPLAPISDQ